MRHGQAAAKVRGLLGAFLAAFFAALLWYWLLTALPALPGGLEKLALLGGLLPAPAACLGYRLLGGFRDRRFAALGTRGCTLLAFVLALPVFALLLFLPGRSLGEAAAAVGLSLRGRKYLGVLGICTLLVALPCGRLGQKGLLRYTDAAWSADPRRMAAEYAGGLLYNCRPQGMPPVDAGFPRSFQVGNALAVEGDLLRTTPSLGRERRFPVEDVAGVVLGPQTGCNVLYDWQGRALGKFAWSMEGSALLAAYLEDQGVPFRPYDQPLDLEGPHHSGGSRTQEAEPEPSGGATEAAGEDEAPSSGGTRLRPDYLLRLRPTAPAAAVGLFCGGTLLSFVLWTASFFLFPPGSFQDRPWVMYLVIAVMAAPIGLAALFAVATGQVLPPFLSVEGRNVYLHTFLGGIRELRWEDMGGMYPWDAAYILFDRRGKTILKFSTRDEWGAVFMKDLQDHGVQILPQPRKK